MSKQSLIFITALLLSSVSLYAEVVTDGSLGAGTPIDGPNYDIGAKFGQQHGGNLFHSFQDFNLKFDESATFSGPNSVQNVISRVTGKNPSHIDGLIISTIPNADMYFLNPYGIMFGEKARLNVQGSFHASTAHYLRLGNGGRFDALNPSNSLLNVASVEAFGFLDKKIASIDIKGEKVFLSVPEEKMLSVIGGSINIEDSVLFAPGGRINLAAIASVDEVGEVEITPDNLHIKASRTGEIKLSHFAERQQVIGSNEEPLIYDYGSDGDDGDDGDGEQAIEPTSSIDEDTTNYEDEGIEPLEMNDPDDGYEDEEPEIREYGNIDVTDHFKETDTGQIFIRGGELLIKRAGISADTFNYEGEQEARIDIDINGNIDLVEGGFITADSHSDSQGGHITIKAENMTLHGQVEELHPDDEDFLDGLSTIATDSFLTGVAGDIDIELTGSLKLVPGAILSTAQDYNGEGEAGNIYIKTREMTLQQGSSINVDTFGGRNAGNITINATDKISLLQNYSYGISSSAFEETMGNAGNIVLNTSELVLTEESPIYSASYGSGNAGSITITTNTAKLTNRSRITTEASQARGGNIHFEVRDKLELFNDSRITAEAGGKNTQDSGGNITIKSSDIFRLDNSNLLANAYAGNGGKIDITTPQFNVLGDSRIDVSSTFGLNGQVWVNGLELNENFMMLSPDFLKVDSLLKNRCIGLTKEDLSTFFVIGRDVSPPSPTDLRTHPYIPEP
jgi:filamentous hemagglutinin family protein